MSVRCWEPGTQYNYGDVVEFESQSSPTSMIPALTGTVLPRCEIQDNPTPQVSGDQQHAQSSLIIVLPLLLRVIGLLP